MRSRRKRPKRLGKLLEARGELWEVRADEPLERVRPPAGDRCPGALHPERGSWSATYKVTGPLGVLHSRGSEMKRRDQNLLMAPPLRGTRVLGMDPGIRTGTNPHGKIVDRYDKCMCTRTDRKHYSGGSRLVSCVIGGITVGLAIC